MASLSLELLFGDVSSGGMRARAVARNSSLAAGKNPESVPP